MNRAAGRLAKLERQNAGAWHPTSLVDIRAATDEQLVAYLAEALTPAQLGCTAYAETGTFTDAELAGIAEGALELCS